MLLSFFSGWGFSSSEILAVISMGHSVVGDSFRRFEDSIRHSYILSFIFDFSIHRFCSSISHFGVSIHDFGVSIHDSGGSIHHFDASFHDFGGSIHH
ncbi:hypothetical protein ACIQGW_24975 [Lysinibacillus xylanilyticus]|uniref:hypothetical protein n=1 Tax=Lysinibacillus xylanilyticus TaxID=582475 RepID=UPI0038107DD5